MQDGYIKYHCHYQSGPAPQHVFLEDLDELRTALFIAGLVGKYEGGPGYGNVSLRNVLSGSGSGSVEAFANKSDEGSSFIISATNTGGTRKLGPEGYCLVTNWSIEENSVKCVGPLAASSEALTHGAIYEASPGVNCVAHLHSAVLFEALLKQGAPGTDPQALYGTPAMARAVKALVKERPKRGLIVMTGHQEGLLVYGKSGGEVSSIINNLQARNF